MSFNKGIDYNLSGTLTLGNSNFKYLTNANYAHLSGTLSASVVSGSQITGSQILADRIQSNNFTGSFSGVFPTIQQINGFLEVTENTNLTSTQLVNTFIIGVVTGSDVIITLPDLTSAENLSSFIIFRSGSFNLSISSSTNYTLAYPGDLIGSEINLPDNSTTVYYRDSNKTYYFIP